MFLRISRFSSDFEGGVESVVERVIVCVLGPVFSGFATGWKVCSPRGVSAKTRKCPVNGGLIADGRVSGSILYSNQRKVT